MTTPTICPDCNQGLKAGAVSCRCGWTVPAQRADRVAEGDVPTVACDTPGCGGAAFCRVGDKNECRRCYEGNVNSHAFADCKARGLNTVDDMRDFCRRKAKELFRRPLSGEAWIENLKQPTVDLMQRMGTESDLLVIERARRACVIDASNKVIPIAKRQALRDRRASRIKEERDRAEKMLAEKARLDAEAAA